MDDIRSGRVVTHTSTAIMALYDALLCALSDVERSKIVDRPCSASARLGALRLGFSRQQSEEISRLVGSYYDANSEDPVRLQRVVALADEVLRMIGSTDEG